MKQAQQNAIKVESGEMKIDENPEPHVAAIGTHALTTKDATLEGRNKTGQPLAMPTAERRRLNQHRRVNEALYQSSPSKIETADVTNRDADRSSIHSRASVVVMGNHNNGLLLANNDRRFSKRMFT